MKLHETGSLTNWMMGGTKGQPEPKTGMGCTFLLWTDRYAGTIVRVTTYRGAVLIGAQTDKAIRTDSNGVSECQSYRFEPDPETPVRWFRQSKSGAFEEVQKNEATGRWVKTGGVQLRIGDRDKYHDYSF